jgi:MinD-like ATPase involved in chromosome partitioning or flagellar assembly
VHIVGAGREPSQRQLLQLPRINLAVDALSRAYDYVVLDAGTATDLPTNVIATQAHAVIIPDPAITSAARNVMREQLLASGFEGVSILDTPLKAMDLGASGERVAAA